LSSWPALFAAALLMRLVLKGPAAPKPSWIQRTYRLAMVFFLYSGFLYLLKWNPFWMVFFVDAGSRSKAEGFLIVVSTIVWLVATARVIGGPDFPGTYSGPSGSRNRAPQQEKLWTSIKNVAVFHFVFTRR